MAFGFLDLQGNTMMGDAGQLAPEIVESYSRGNDRGFEKQAQEQKFGMDEINNAIQRELIPFTTGISAMESAQKINLPTPERTQEHVDQAVKEIYGEKLPSSFSQQDQDNILAKANEIASQSIPAVDPFDPSEWLAYGRENQVSDYQAQKDKYSAQTQAKMAIEAMKQANKEEANQQRFEQQMQKFMMGIDARAAESERDRDFRGSQKDTDRQLRLERERKAAEAKELEAFKDKIAAEYKRFGTSAVRHTASGRAAWFDAMRREAQNPDPKKAKVAEEHLMRAYKSLDPKVQNTNKQYIQGVDSAPAQKAQPKSTSTPKANLPERYKAAYEFVQKNPGTEKAQKILSVLKQKGLVE